MSRLWTRDDAVQATGGTCGADWTASGVSIDTRSLHPGDLFVALSDVRDGHDFVAQALAQGAAAALVSRIPDGVAADAPLLLVDDVLVALGALGRAARSRTQAQVVAITGSVGKTSTKEMLRTILQRQGKTHCAEGSYNNHWGVPLTLARMPVNVDYAVFEIGMNHPGEIAPLAEMVRPDVALITNVAAVHMEYFDDLAGIAREKAAIFAGLGPNGVAVINAAPPAVEILRNSARNAGAQVISFGDAPGPDFALEQVLSSDDMLVVQAQHAGAPLLFKLAALGPHFALNGLSALGVVQALDADLALAAMDLALWSPPAGRGAREIISLDLVDDHLSITLIDDAFNASPISMQAALGVLAGAAVLNRGGRKVAILGDMLELGPEGPRLHHDLADLPALSQIDIVHTVGPLMAQLHSALPDHRQGECLQTAPELAAKVGGLLRPGDLVLVKGSKGSKVSLCVDAIRKLGHPVPTQKGST